jgi:hypothetical protein
LETLRSDPQAWNTPYIELGAERVGLVHCDPLPSVSTIEIQTNINLAWNFQGRLSELLREDNDGACWAYVRLVIVVSCSLTEKRRCMWVAKRAIDLTTRISST